MDKSIEVETLPEVWAGFFEGQPKKIMPNQKQLEAQVSKFGEAYGTVKAEIIKLKLSGMLPAASNMQSKLVTLETEFDSRLYDYLGYKLLPLNIRDRLTTKATSVGKYLNEYNFASYPRPIPTEVLESINAARTFFPSSSIKIWAIENEPLLKDPVVVGEILQNNIKKYYLIAIWDNDIELSDLVDTKELQEVN